MSEKNMNLEDKKIKKSDFEPVYDDIDKYIKTKIKIYKNKVHINFQG